LYTDGVSVFQHPFNDGASFTSIVDRNSGRITYTSSKTGDGDTKDALTIDHQGTDPNDGWTISPNAFVDIVGPSQSPGGTLPTDWPYQYQGTPFFGVDSSVEFLLNSSRWSCWESFLGVTPGSAAGNLAGANVTISKSVTANEIHVTIRQEWPDPTDEHGNVIFSCGVAFGAHWTLQIDVTLDPGSAYSTTDLNQDVDNLLLTWDLASDAQYPWRQDLNTTAGPLVTRDEKGPTSPDIGYNATFIDSSPETGAVLGAPNPVGYEPYFDFRHKNWEFCTDLSSGTGNWYINSYGAYAPGWARHATQWVDDFQAKIFPQGAFVAFSSLKLPVIDGVYGQDTLIKAKYAEVLLPRPSHNFFRPAARDRYRFDDSTVRCVTGVAGSTVTLRDPLPITVSSSDRWMLIGTTGDGVYQTATKISDTQFSVSQKIADIPSVLHSHSPFFGKLRWPDAPGIRGKVRFGAVAQGGTLTITATSDVFLRTGDSVLITGAEPEPPFEGITPPNINGAWSITVIDSTHFTINSPPSDPNFLDAYDGWIQSYGAPDPKWDDNSSKGDWCLLSFDYNFRDVGERERLHQAFLDRQFENQNRTLNSQPLCQAFSDPAPLRPNTGPWSAVTLDQHQWDFLPCCQPIVLITPNGEQAPGSQPPFPLAEPPCDSRYGNLWQCIPKPWMQDPLWQAPPRPCALDNRDHWVEDDGSGQQDHEEYAEGSPDPYWVRYFAQRPWEECRTAVPAGAPLLPAGTYLGCLTIDQLNQTSVPAGNVYYPPSQGVNYFAPWDIYLKERDNVHSNGRFSCEYGDPQATCSDDFIEDLP
jgi:hypothetical protein